MSKVITNESELNTGTDLITKYLNLELLALKDPTDLRKFSRDFMKIDEVLTPATKSEIESILNQNLIKDVLELATEQDIRNLFVGTVLEGGETYNLSSLSTDESKVVNMRLLSLFNDLLLQKITGNKNELTNLINSIKRTLENSIALKEDKTKVADLINTLKNELTNLINKKANSSVKIVAGTGLKGGGTLENNVTLSLDYGTAEEIKNILK